MPRYATDGQVRANTTSLKALEAAAASAVSHAPSDGGWYLSRNGGWEEPDVDGEYRAFYNGDLAVVPDAPVDADVPVDGTNWVRRDGAWVQPPNDGQQWALTNGVFSVVLHPGGTGISHAPADTRMYFSRDGGWATTPTDGVLYGIQDGQQTVVPDATAATVTNAADIDTLETTVGGHTTLIGSNATDIGTNNTAIGDLTTDKNQLQLDIIAANDDILINADDLATEVALQVLNWATDVTATGVQDLAIGNNTAYRVAQGQILVPGTVAHSGAWIALHGGIPATATANALWITNNGAKPTNNETAIGFNDTELADHELRVVALEGAPATTAHAPNDGRAYFSQSGGWATVPTDGVSYVFQDGVFVELPTTATADQDMAGFDVINAGALRGAAGVPLVLAAAVGQQIDVDSSVNMNGHSLVAVTGFLADTEDTTTTHKVTAGDLATGGSTVTNELLAGGAPLIEDLMSFQCPTADADGGTNVSRGSETGEWMLCDWPEAAATKLLHSVSPMFDTNDNVGNEYTVKLYTGPNEIWVDGSDTTLDGASVLVHTFPLFVLGSDPTPEFIVPDGTDITLTKTQYFGFSIDGTGAQNFKHKKSAQTNPFAAGGYSDRTATDTLRDLILFEVQTRAPGPTRFEVTTANGVKAHEVFKAPGVDNPDGPLVLSGVGGVKMDDAQTVAGDAYATVTATGTNATNIGTNATDIGTNATDITALQTAGYITHAPSDTNMYFSRNGGWETTPTDGKLYGIQDGQQVEVPAGTGSADWSTNPATQNVDMNANSLLGADAVVADRFTANAGGAGFQAQVTNTIDTGSALVKLKDAHYAGTVNAAIVSADDFIVPTGAGNGIFFETDNQADVGGVLTALRNLYIKGTIFGSNASALFDGLALGTTGLASDMAMSAHNTHIVGTNAVRLQKLWSVQGAFQTLGNGGSSFTLTDQMLAGGIDIGENGAGRAKGVYAEEFWPSAVVRPSSDNAVDLGVPGFARFRDGYVVNGITTGSDMTLKTLDVAVPIGSSWALLIAVNSAGLISYNWKPEFCSGPDCRHVSWSAQAVEAAIVGVDTNVNDELVSKATWTQAHIDKLTAEQLNAIEVAPVVGAHIVGSYGLNLKTLVPHLVQTNVDLNTRLAAAETTIADLLTRLETVENAIVTYHS